jgi:hypothetical protein
VKSPQQTVLEELSQYDFVGFGSGICRGQHHESLIDLAISYRKSPARKRLFSQLLECQSSFRSTTIGRVHKQNAEAFAEKLKA